MNGSYRFKAVAALALGAWMGIGVTNASAGNAPITTDPNSPAYGHEYRHGVMPTIDQLEVMKRSKQMKLKAGLAATGPKTLYYHGGVSGVGVTSGTPKVYLVVYGAQWGTASTNSNGYLSLSGDAVGAVPYLQALFKGLGTNGELWSGTMTQYCDGPNVSNNASSCPANAAHVGYPSNGVLAGIWYDNTVSSPASATAADLAAEAVRAAAHFGNTTAASNRYAQYVILSPTGTTPDGFNTSGSNFCAWHDHVADTSASSPYGDMAFTNMPYLYDMGSRCGAGFVTGSNLDGYSIVGGHEYAETVSDQFPDGGWWTYDSAGHLAENGDECAWVKTGQGASATVAMATGTFAMQSTWSNDTNQCEIAHPIITNGGGTPNCNGGIADATAVTCAAAGLSGYTGTAYTQVYTTYSGGGSCTQVAAPGYDTSRCVAPSRILQNGVPVTGLSMATNAQLTYTFNVPAGATSVNFATSGGTGDVDLYVGLGSAPTVSTYLQKSDGPTTTESISISNPQAGTYYALLNAYNAPSGFQLVANYSTAGGNVLGNGVAVTGLGLASGTSRVYTIVVPAGRSSLTVKTSGGTGDADIYLSLGSTPSTTSYQYKSNGPTTAESITVSNPAAGTYYLLLNSYATFSGVSLIANY